MLTTIGCNSQVDALRDALLRTNVGDGEAVVVLLRVMVLDTGEIVFTQEGINPHERLGSWTYRVLDISSLPVFYTPFEAEPGYWWIPAQIAISVEGIYITLRDKPYIDTRVFN